MKRFFQYTFKEITAESMDVTRKQLLEIECMIRGISILGAPDEPKHERPKTTQWVYEVCGLAFKTRSNAEALLDWVEERADDIVVIERDWANHANWISKPIKGHYSFPSVDAKDVYSRDEYKNFKAILNEQTKERKEYDERLEDFKKTGGVAEEIDQIICEFFGWYFGINRAWERFQAEFERYCEIADAETAERFFVNERSRFKVGNTDVWPIMVGMMRDSRPEFMTSEEVMDPDHFVTEQENIREYIEAHGGERHG